MSRHQVGVHKIQKRVGSRCVWDDRHGHYFLDWREGRKRKREYAGGTPAEATEAQRRKRNELLGALLSQGKTAPAAENESLLTIARAREMFLDHVRAHSPDKPETVRRYEQVLGHFERILGHKKYVESIERSDIDTYKIKRSAEKSLRHDRPITPRTINFEVSALRTLFYYLENERGLKRKAIPCNVLYVI